MPRGGGHEGSLRFLSVLGVLGVLIVAGVVVIDQGDESDAAVGDTFTVGNLEYEVITEGEVAVADTTSTRISGVLAIPSTVSDGMTTYSVTSIGDRAFQDCNKLTSVTIPDSVTSIGEYAFNRCSGLTSVTIPDSVTSIGEYAFNLCSALVEIHVNQNNQNYSSTDGVLFNKDGSSLIICGAGKIGQYIVPDGVTSIGNSAFYNCSGLTSVTIPESVTSIGEYAFYYCSGLTSVTIPSSMISIENNTFRGCSGLTSITIPGNITSIGEYAFGNCTGLTSVTIPESVTSIGDSAFSRCSGLTSVTIPGSVTSISFHAFSYCTGLTSVTISDGVAIIDSFAFYECTGLTTITIPASVNRIVNSAFFLCSSLTEINVAPSNLDFSSLEGVLFNKDYTDLVLYPRGIQGAYSVPDGTIFISDSAFSGCLGLTSVTIPDGMYSISTGSFWDCSNLTSVTFESATAPFFGTNSFNTGTELNVSTPGWDPTEAMAGAIGNNGTTVIWANPQQVPVGTTFDYDGLRYKITETGLELTGYVTKPTGDLVIPETVPYRDGSFKVTSIGDSAFYSCTGLTSVTIPESVTSIGRQAFYNCYSLGSVTFEGTVDSFGESAFQYCSILSQFIFLGDAPTQVGTNAFATNALVYELQTPTYVDTPGWDPFDILTGGKVLMNTDIIWSNPPTFECDGLYYLAISDTEAELYYPPEGTYSGDVTVPQTVMDGDGNQYTVTGIGNYAFYEAENMTSIVLPPTIDKLGYCAFYRAPVSEITFQSAEPPSEMRSSCAEFWNTVDVYTPGWDPEVALDDYHSIFTNIVWANQSSSDLTFVSDPVADGIIAWISTRT